MKYEIRTVGYSDVLVATLSPNEYIYTKPGGVISSKGPVDIYVETVSKSLIDSIVSMTTGQGELFRSKVVAREDAEVILGGVVGKIKSIDINNQTLYVADSTYLAHAGDLELKYELAIGGKGGIFKGLSTAGFLISTLVGRGTVFLEASGGIIEYSLSQNETLYVDNWNFLATDINWKEGVDVIRLTKGISAKLFASEGIFLSFRGPGRVWIKTNPTVARYFTSE
ncbi:MAG: AIM24 family protein [Candidatus Micrarchaeota archaeon]|nr:AIM24 family protein [Candidatus Micrarchaeota archaeon]MCX8154759.1 AIM24 family protein [Candidatus Micrarchaeota archaeon]